MGTSIQFYIRKVGKVWFAAALNDKCNILASSFSTSKDGALRRLAYSGRGAEIADIVITNSRKEVIDAMVAIYQGKEPFLSMGLDFSWCPPFYRRVYDVVRRIPIGFVSTYSFVANATGARNAARAVGSAMARNPLPLFIPCHRVVPSTLRVGGYSVGKGVDSKLKRQLLEREGVRFKGSRIESSCVWNFKNR
jgi:O-6-methylguanine DNA methyltransferase